MLARYIATGRDPYVPEPGAERRVDWKETNGPRWMTTRTIASSVAVVATIRGVVVDLTEVVNY